MKLYCDGGVVKANPSPEGVYWSVAEEAEGAPLKVYRYSSSKYKTNNEAEYLAIITALTRAVAMCSLGLTDVTIYSDSQLIVRQLLGRYQCRDPRMLALLARARELYDPLPESVKVEWVRRNVMVEKLGH